MKCVCIYLYCALLTILFKNFVFTWLVGGYDKLRWLFVIKIRIVVSAVDPLMTNERLDRTSPELWPESCKSS